MNEENIIEVVGDTLELTPKDVPVKVIEKEDLLRKKAWADKDVIDALEKQKEVNGLLEYFN